MERSLKNGGLREAKKKVKAPKAEACVLVKKKKKSKGLQRVAVEGRPDREPLGWGEEKKYWGTYW